MWFLIIGIIEYKIQKHVKNSFLVWDILRCVSAAVAKLSLGKCENKSIKAAWHLKDKFKNRKLSKSQKSKPSIA